MFIEIGAKNHTEREREREREEWFKPTKVASTLFYLKYLVGM